MIPLLYQLSYTGTKGKDSVIPPRCPVEPTSSGSMDVRKRSGVLPALKNLWIPESCRLCSQPPLAPTSRHLQRPIPEDFLLCKSCAMELEEFGRICPRCLHLPGSTASSCPLCKIQVPLRPHTALGPHSGTLRRWILWAKHGDRPDLATALSREMACQWKKCMELSIQADAPFSAVSPEPVLVPIPRSPWRVLLKGQPLTEFLTRRLAEDLKLPQKSLLAQSGISAQAKKSARQRMGMSPRRFRVKQSRLSPSSKFSLLKWIFPGTGSSRIILVDDVMTTGTTLKTATRVLENAGHRVVGWLTASVTPR